MYKVIIKFASPCNLANIMTTKDHYEKHLANFYSWTAGDFELKSKDFQIFLSDHKILPLSSKVAIDLGAGHGIQSAALARTGFKVWAVDFNEQLLEELKHNCAGLNVTPVEQDIRLVTRYEDLNPELIVCWGDTLTHLENESDVERFIDYTCEILKEGGKFILSFRDYSEKRTGNARFIPVKSDETRILTCFLEYSPTHVTVTDLLHEFDGKTWQQKVSSYNKFRITREEACDLLKANGMTISFSDEKNGLITIIAEK